MKYHKHTLLFAFSALINPTLGYLPQKLINRSYFSKINTNNNSKKLSNRCISSSSSLLSSTAAAEPVIDDIKVSSKSKQLVAIKLDDDLSKDLTGHVVTFTNKTDDASNTTNGLIVAQRFPVAFVWIPYDNLIENFDSMESSSYEISDQKWCMSFDNNNSNGFQILDCFGNSLSDSSREIDGNDKSNDASVQSIPLIGPTAQVADIALINRPLLTGHAMVDALTPIGKGQNMLFVGEFIDDASHQTSTIALDAIQTQLKLGNVRCIYALTRNDNNSKQVLETLKKLDSNDKLTCIAIRDGIKKDAMASAAEGTMVAGAACALASHWSLMDNSDCFVVVDDVRVYKQFWDFTTKELVEIYGYGAVVKDDKGASSEMRSYMSNLVQQSAQLKSGGSVTLALLQQLPPEPVDAPNDSADTFTLSDFADSPVKVKERIEQLEKANIPITSSVLKKIKIPVPSQSNTTQEELDHRLAIMNTEDLISMTDGQIWLSKVLFENGQVPALDATRSITRVGIGADTESKADAPVVRDIVKSLRLELTQALELDTNTTNPQDLKQIVRKDAWILAMSQTPGKIRRLSEEVVQYIAASCAVLDQYVGKISPDESDKLFSRLYETIATELPEIFDAIDKTGQWNSPGDKAALTEAVKKFFDNK